jgi:hypothetical protein
MIQGVIFLTTNRLTAFDPAFESRIQLKLFYSPLIATQRANIWKSLMPKSSLDVKAQTSDDFFTKLGNKYDINGREIKNMIKVAIAIAEHENVPVDERHLEKVAAMNQEWARIAK